MVECLQAIILIIGVPFLVMFGATMGVLSAFGWYEIPQMLRDIAATYRSIRTKEMTDG